MEIWQTLKRKWAFNIVGLVGGASLIVWSLKRSGYADAALLYVAVPFGIGLALAWLRESVARGQRSYSFGRFLLDSLIVMLASSLVLMEGFLCVLMFMPIYFTMAVLAYGVYDALSGPDGRPRGGAKAFVLPLLVLVPSVEGLSENLSFERTNTVTVSQVVEQTPEEIHANLRQPIELDQQERPLFLRVFPMPYNVEAGTLAAGDIHEIHYRYRRWFWGNTHEGRARLQIESVAENRIQTRFLDDTSYISHYMTLHGTEIELQPTGDERTRVNLTIRFDRTLDPAWYFGPLQRWGVGEMGDFLIAEVIARNGRY